MDWRLGTGKPQEGEVRRVRCICVVLVVLGVLVDISTYILMHVFL